MPLYLLKYTVYYIIHSVLYVYIFIYQLTASPGLLLPVLLELVIGLWHLFNLPSYINIVIIIIIIIIVILIPNVPSSH